jgi:GT2 family glycosyltransferase
MNPADTDPCRKAPSFSVMITTRDRLEDLKRTCRVLQKLDPPPVEIFITADGCTDGTVEFVRSDLPTARLIVNAVGRGSVASRDRMMREARGDLVLALDDDSYPERMDCLARLATLFMERPRLAVAHFPQHTDEYPETLAQTDFGKPRLTRSFANSGACLRRSVYLQLPGFEPLFFHMYEEPDYALQCVAGGYEIYYTGAIIIRHHWSGQSRSRIKNHHRHAQNKFWSILMRCPLPYSPGLAVYHIFSQFGFACRQSPSWVVQEPVWWWNALRGLPRILRQRQPVSWAAFRRWLRLEDKQWLDAAAENPSFWKARNAVREAR